MERRLIVPISRANRIQNPMTSRTFLTTGQRNRPSVNVVLTRQGPGIGFVNAEVSLVDVVINVPGLISDQVELIRPAVPTAERREAPVRLDGGEDGVVRVEGVVGGILQMLRNGPTEEDAEDTVRFGVRHVLVEGEEDERAVHEVRVIEEGAHPVAFPPRREGDVGIVAVVGHVGGDEGPLGQFLVGQVGVEVGEVLDLA